MTDRLSDFVANYADKLYGMKDRELELEAEITYKDKSSFNRSQMYGHTFPSQWDLIEQELRDRKMFSFMKKLDPHLLEE